MLVHEATVCRSVSFILASKGLLLRWCAGVCDGKGKIEVRIGWFGVLMLTHK